MINCHNIENILSSLSEVTAVSGNEKESFDKIKSFFDEDAVIDSLNSIKFISQKGSDKKFLLDAHIDQIGFAVTDITDKGFVKVGAVGGVDARILRASDVVVHTSQGDFFGVVTCVPPHLSGKDENSAPDADEIIIDVGMSFVEAEKMISRGDSVSFKYKNVNLLNDTITGVSFDNKAGVAVLIRTYQILKEKNCFADVTYLFSSQEEAGMRGTGVAIFGADIDEAICVDVSFATAPDVEKTHAGHLSKGPMVCLSPTIDKSVSDGLLKTAKDNNIDCQIEICSGNTGTNADVISLLCSGIKTGLVSVPLRNMHTFSEVICLEDIENSARLIAEYILKGGRNDD